MAKRDLYLAAYDVSEPRRLVAALALVRGFATGGRKSVHEVFLTPYEKRELIHAMSLLLDEDHDRFLLLRLDRHARSMTLGRASPPGDPAYFYVS